MSYYDTHETDSLARYNEMQGKLIKTVEETDEAGLRILSAQIDIQLKLEDFLVKFREADHATTKVWGAIFGPPTIAALLAIILALIAWHVEK